MEKQVQKGRVALDANVLRVTVDVNVVDEASAKVEAVGVMENGTRVDVQYALKKGGTALDLWVGEQLTELLEAGRAKVFAVWRIEDGQ